MLVSYNRYRIGQFKDFAEDYFFSKSVKCKQWKGEVN
jgi:hypothetical protein